MSTSSNGGVVEEEDKWGTRHMGAPAVPSAHPHNQQAATWVPPSHGNPYVVVGPASSTGPSRPVEAVLAKFNAWGRKTEAMANNVWQNLRTAPSVSEAAWGKLSLTAKAISEGGFESLYRQTFNVGPGDRLRKTFACYLSTSTGPVAGTLYLSNLSVAFCSDRPLGFTAPSGQLAWCLYKVFISLANVSAINPISMRENPSERYIQVVTIDGHDFWFMGFVNYDKASAYLSETLSHFIASRASH